jgi:hypothetical protein
VILLYVDICLVVHFSCALCYTNCKPTLALLDRLDPLRSTCIDEAAVTDVY